MDRRQRADDRGAVRAAATAVAATGGDALTSSALEQLTRPIASALYPRCYALKNRTRLNRLLMLMQLHINGDDDIQAYSKTIRKWLETNEGRPTARRRAIADPLGSPSLR